MPPTPAVARRQESASRRVPLETIIAMCSLSTIRARRARPIASFASRAALCAVALLAACAPGNPLSPDGAVPDRVPAGAYYLRAIDGRALPMSLPDGLRIEAGFVVADSANAGTIGWKSVV